MGRPRGAPPLSQLSLAPPRTRERGSARRREGPGPREPQKREFYSYSSNYFYALVFHWEPQATVTRAFVTLWGPVPGDRTEPRQGRAGAAKGLFLASSALHTYCVPFTLSAVPGWVLILSSEEGGTRAGGVRSFGSLLTCEYNGARRHQCPPPTHTMAGPPLAPWHPVTSPSIGLLILFMGKVNQIYRQEG